MSSCGQVGKLSWHRNAQEHSPCSRLPRGPICCQHSPTQHSQPHHAHARCRCGGTAPHHSRPARSSVHAECHKSGFVAERCRALPGRAVLYWLALHCQATYAAGHDTTAPAPTKQQSHSTAHLQRQLSQVHLCTFWPPQRPQPRFDGLNRRQRLAILPFPHGPCSAVASSRRCGLGRRGCGLRCRGAVGCFVLQLLPPNALCHPAAGQQENAARC